MGRRGGAGLGPEITVWASYAQIGEPKSPKVPLYERGTLLFLGDS